MNKKYLSIILSTAALLMMTGCRKEIDLNDYLEIDTNGYDSAGTIDYELNVADIIEDNPEAFDLDSTDSMEALEVALKLDGTFSGKLDKSNNLSNGDKVNFTWDKNIDTNKLEKKYPVKFKYKNKTIKVDGLKETTKADPFEYIDVTFEGIAPNGKANINCRLSEIDVSLSPSADKKEGLSNGDIIKVKFENGSEDIMDSFLRYGIIPDSVEKEYTVSGLSSYAQKISDIPKESIDKMDTYAQDKLKARVAEKWSEKEQLLNVKLLGNYLLTPKFNNNSDTDNNILYFIYSIEAKNENTDAPFSYYYYTYYKNIINLDDGTCSVALDNAVAPQGSSSFGNLSGEAFHKGGSFYYTGYENLDTLFNKHVTSKIDKYNYESTVK